MSRQTRLNKNLVPSPGNNHPAGISASLAGLLSVCPPSPYTSKEKQVKVTLIQTIAAIPGSCQNEKVLPGS